MGTNKKTEEPSKKYKEMMDEILHRLEAGKLEYSSIEDVKKQYGI